MANFFLYGIFTVMMKLPDSHFSPVIARSTRDRRSCNFSWIVAGASDATRSLLPDFQCTRLKPHYTALVSDVYLYF